MSPLLYVIACYVIFVMLHACMLFVLAYIFVMLE